MSLRSFPLTFVVAYFVTANGMIAVAIPSECQAQSLDYTALSLLNGDGLTGTNSSDDTAAVSSPLPPTPSEHYQHRKNLKRAIRKPAQVLTVPDDAEKPADATANSDVKPGGPTSASKVFSDADKLALKNEHYGLGARFRDLTLGGTDAEIEMYRKALKPDDARLNRFELQVAPMYIYNDSKSSNWARTYQTNAPAFDVDGRLWFSPTLALEAQYTSSFPSGVPRAPGVSALDQVQDRWLSLGARFRRFYGPFHQPTSFTLGLDYTQYQHSSELHDGDYRNRFTTYGPRVTLDALIPSSHAVAWRVGVEIIPFGFENEDSNTNPQIVSGAHSQTMRVGAWFGPEYTLNRGSRIFFKATGQLQHTSYDSMTSYNSPVSGAPVSAEGITNTFLMVELGYLWGN